jgi:hypothetical protein
MQGPSEPRPRKGPEGKIQWKLVRYLRARGWVVMETHGNLYQKGFPDLYCTHIKYGARWVEVKNPLSYSFTTEQYHSFPLLESGGAGVWILVAATEEEYLKLWRPSNYHHYMKEMRVISRPRPSVKFNEGYKPRYPTPGLKKDGPNHDG